MTLWDKFMNAAFVAIALESVFDAVTSTHWWTATIYGGFALFFAVGAMVYPSVCRGER